MILSTLNSLPTTNSNETEHHIMNGIKLKDKDMIPFCPSMKTILRNYHSFRLLYKEALKINPSPSIYFLYQNFYDLKRKELYASKKLNNKSPTDSDHLSLEDNTSTTFSVATKDTSPLEVNTLPIDKTTKRKRSNDLPNSKKVPKISLSSTTDGNQNSSRTKNQSSSNDTLSEAKSVDSSSTSPDETSGKLTKAKSKSKTGGGKKTYVIQPSVHRHSSLTDLPPHDIKVTNDMLMRNHVASLIHSPNFSSSNLKRLISDQRKIDKLCTKLYTICDKVKSSSQYRNSNSFKPEWSRQFGFTTNAMNANGFEDNQHYYREGVGFHDFNKRLKDLPPYIKEVWKIGIDLVNIVDPNYIKDQRLIMTLQKMGESSHVKNHRDKTDSDSQIIVSFGSYSGGWVRIFNETNDRYIDIDTFHNPFKNDGRLNHFVHPVLNGYRYSLIIYRHVCEMSSADKPIYDIASIANRLSKVCLEVKTDLKDLVEAVVLNLTKGESMKEKLNPTGQRILQQFNESGLPMAQTDRYHIKLFIGYIMKLMPQQETRNKYIKQILIAFTMILIGHSNTHKRNVALPVSAIDSTTDFLKQFRTYNTGYSFFLKKSKKDTTLVDTHMETTSSAKGLQDPKRDKELESWLNVNFFKKVRGKKKYVQSSVGKLLYDGKKIKDKPYIIFGNVSQFQTIAILFELGFLRNSLSIDTQRSEYDDWFPTNIYTKGGSWKLVSRILHGDNKETLLKKAEFISYIVSFSRKNDISSSTFENLLCKLNRLIE